MKIGPGGVFICESLEELNFQFLNAAGLSCNPEGIVYDNEIGTQIKFSNKILKASTSPYNIRYPGEGEIMLDILGNIKMVTSIFGLVLDKLRVMDNKEIISYYPEEVDYKIEGLKRFRVIVKFENLETLVGNFYFNRCLSLVDVILQLGELNVDLVPFDYTEEFLLKK